MIGRLRAWLTAQHLAQACLVLQPVIVLRTSYEYLRVGPEAAAYVSPLFASLGVVGGFSVISLLLYFVGRYRWVVGGTFAMIAILAVYKLTAMPGLS